MKSRITQYILILIILTGIAGGYFYFQSKADQKINSSKVNNLTSGLVGYWTMDGADTTATTALDMSTNDNVGTINGTVAKTIGKIGQAFNFDGSTGYLNAGSPNLNVTDITECAWIYPKVISGNHVITHYVNVADGDNMLIRLSSAGLLQMSDQNDIRLQSNTTFSINNWYHVCATHDYIGLNNNDYKIYINGVLDNSNIAAVHTSYLEGGSSLNIGAVNGGTQKFNGYIDEARIYNRVLSASEITELYQQGQTKINASQAGKLTSELVGYWTFDGADTSWSGNTATLTNKGSLGATANGTSSGMSQTTSPAIGKIGQTFSFDGGDDYVSAANLGITTGDYSIAFWAKLNASNASWDFAIGRNPQSRGIFMDTTGGKWGTYDGSSTLTSNSSANVVGAWYHLTVTRSGSNYVFYLNGVNDGGGTMADGINPSQIYIGRRGDDVSSFNGSIDEVRLYSRVISQSEITELYQQGQTKINASQTNRLTNGLVGYWTMDGADMTATEAIDKSSSGRNGTLSGSPSRTIGKVGQALNLDGSDDYVEIADTNNTYDFGNGNFSASFWLSCNDVNGYVLAKDESVSHDDGLNFYCTSQGAGNLGRLYYHINGGSEPIMGITDNNWHHFVAVREGQGSNQMKFYKDNVLSGTTSTDARNLTNAHPLRMGTGADNVFSLNAKIDEVRLYNRALSQSEVMELYNQGR